VKEPWKTSKKGRMGKGKKGAALGFDYGKREKRGSLRV